MKKVLALIVAFALCFTAFAGCFATSAAPVTGYAFDITAADDDLTSDGGDVVVTVSGKYTTIDTAQYLVVTLPANVEFVSVAGGEDISEVDNPTEETVILYAFDEAANQIKFLEACEPDVDFAIEITVNVPAYSEEATNEYVIEANAQVAAFDAASSEDITTIEDSVTITVPAPHVHQAAADAAWQNDADNHWKVCAEHADVKVEEAAHDYNTVVTEPTTEAGGYTTYTCKVCAYAYTADETDPLPPAGPKEFTVNLNNRTLQLESKILVNVWVLESELPAGYNLNNMFLAVTKPGDTEPTIVTPVRGKNGSNWYYRFAYAGLSSVEMGVDFEYYVYKTDDNGEITDVSNSNTYAVIDYIESVLIKREDVASYAELCTLLADVANYGAAAQTNFNMNTDKLVNQWNDDVIRLVDKYETKTNPSLTLCPAPTDEGLAVNTTLDLQAEVRINYVVKKSDVDAKINALGATTEDLKFVVTYADGETKEYTGTDITLYYNNGTPYYRATFKEFNATQFREVASCVVYVGNTKISQTKQMSMEGYSKSVINNNNKPNLVALVTAMMKYGDSAYAYVN